MNKRIMVVLSIGCVLVGLIAGTYIFSRSSHNKAYEKGLFVNGEVNMKYAGYIC